MMAEAVFPKDTLSQCLRVSGKLRLAVVGDMGLL